MKGMNPMDDPRIQAHRHIPATVSAVNTTRSRVRRGMKPGDIVYQQQVKRERRPSAGPPKYGGYQTNAPLTQTRRFKHTGREGPANVLTQLGEDKFE